jgi:hypothetical protein
MLAIGMSVREARERRGLTIADVEKETRIRTKYLGALEAERFDALPARAYARAFLREYTEFLGLDSEKFLEEFDARFPVVEEEPLAPSDSRARGGRGTSGQSQPVPRSRRSACSLGGSGVPSPAAPPLRPEPTQTPQVRTTARPKAREPLPKTPTLVLVAARGGCWIEAHTDSRGGPLLYRATLKPGERLRLKGRRLWLRLGAPWKLEAKLDGRRVALPRTVSNVVIPPRAPSA